MVVGGVRAGHDRARGHAHRVRVVLVFDADAAEAGGVEVGDVAGGVDIRSAGLQAFVDDDSVRDLESGVFGQGHVGFDAQTGHHAVDLDVDARTGIHEDVAVAGDARHGVAGDHADALVLVAGGHVLRQRPGESFAEHAIVGKDHRHRAILHRQGGGDFRADVAAADHGEALVVAREPSQRVVVGTCPVVDDVVAGAVEHSR